MEPKVLETIKIAVIAPTSAGKTALISTVCDYIKTKSNKARGYTLEIENQAARNLNSFRDAVSAQLAGQNMSFKSALITATTETEEYKFSMNFTDKATGLSIKQPFDIMDIPGSFVIDRYKYESDTEYNKFIDHLDKSRILWVPIDTPILMECETPNEKSKSDMLRCRPAVQEFCVEWAQYAAENDKLDFCDFVLVKCEKYFSHDEKNEYNGCKHRFDDSYGQIVEAMKEVNQEDKFACVAVETIGAARVNTVKWVGDNLEVQYVATGNTRKIQGADCLLRDALLVAKSNVDAEIKIQKAAKETDKSKFDKLLSDIIAEQEQKIKEMESRKYALEAETMKLRGYEQQVKDASWWDRLKGVFGFGSLPELKEKIRNLQAHLNSLTSEIETAKNKLAALRTNAENTRGNIVAVENEIAALDKVKEWFKSLSSGNTDSKYYRSL